MPRYLNPATVTAHISNDAHRSYGDYCFSLRRAGINLTTHEIFKRLMLGLSQKHFELLLDDAIMQMSNDQLAPSKEHAVTYQVGQDAHLAYEELVHRLQHKRRGIKYGKQVVQGLCLALERPEVRTPLLALMQADQS